MQTRETDHAAKQWDHTTHRDFYDYYAQKSLDEATLQRFLAIREMVLRVLGDRAQSRLKVADVGCNAGTQCRLWAESGHDVYGLDINQPLVSLAHQRMLQDGVKVEFCVGSATDLPWADASMDVCIAPELLEHVADWRSCLDEFMRVLKPGGVLYLTTTNKLCPVQQEFNLPGYSWYPGFLKRRCERLAVTTRPGLANHAKYPAVNWFTFFGLRDYLARFGCVCLDRFDVMDASGKKGIAGIILQAIRRISLLRLLAHVATPYTRVVAVKQPAHL